MIILHCWSPGASQPTLDPFSLSIITYLSFSNCSEDVTLAYSSNPKLHLPFLEDKNVVVYGQRDILNHLKKRGFNLDEMLTSHQKADSLATSYLVNEWGYDALLYNWWLEGDNYVQNTRPVYSNGLFGRYTIPGAIRERAKARIGIVESGRVGKEGDAKVVYERVRRLYELVDAKLEKSTYMYGDTPSSLDAIVYGHLALHAYPSMATPTLFKMLAFEFPKLLAWIQMVRNRVVVGETIKVKSESSWWEWTKEEVVENESVKKARVERFKRMLFAGVGVLFFSGFVLRNVFAMEADGEDGDHDEDE